MQLHMTIETMEDAVLGRAALDGLLGAYAGRGSVKPLGVTDFGPLPTPVTGGTMTGRFHNPAADTLSNAPAASTVETGTAEPETGSTEPAGSTESAGTAESKSSGPKAGEFSKDQIKQAAEKNPTLAALVQGRGRKSDAQKAEITRLTAETLGLPIPAPAGQSEPVGAALKGATAQELQAALVANTQVVHSEPGVEVRTAPQPEQPPAAAAPVPQPQQQTPAPASPIAGDSSLAELLAARKAATQGGASPAPAPVQAGSTPVSAPVVQAGAMPPTPPFVEDTAQYQQGKKPLDQMNAEELLQAIRDYSDQGAGLFWFREVVTRSKAGDQNKMSVDYMREVLANPQAYYPNAV